MAMKLINDTHLTGIASTVRNKLGIATTYKPRELSTAVQNAIDKYRNACSKAISTSVCNNALDVPIVNYDIYGNSTQNTTTGSNLLDETYCKTGTYTVQNPYKGIETNIVGNQTLYIKARLKSGKTAISGLYIALSSNINPNVSESQYIFFVSNGIENEDVNTFSNNTNLYFSYYPTSVSVNDIFDTYEFWVATTNTSYEPYTGGIASPNPSYPQEITSVGDLVTSGEHQGKYKIPVTVSGKNLFKAYQNSGSITANGITCTMNDDNTVTLNGTATSACWFEILRYFRYGTDPTTIIHIQLNASKNYLLKSYIMSGNYTGTCKIYAQIRSYSSEVSHLIGNSSVISNSDGIYRTWFYVAKDTVLDNLKIKINLQDNSIADTTYEPYHTPYTTDIYLNSPLRKIGNVADYIDFVTGKRHNLIGRSFYNGTESWDFKTNTSTTLNRVQRGLNNSEFGNNLLLNYFTKAPGYNNQIANTAYIYANGYIWIYFEKTMFSTVEDWKNWLSTHNTEVIYQLATETTEDITLPCFNLWNGTNIFTIGTEVTPSAQTWQYITTV